MAVVSFKKKDLEDLIGKRLTENILKNRLPMMGCPLENMNEEEVEFEVFPNRPDLLSTEGFARSVRYFLGLSKDLEEYETKKSGIELKREGKVKVRPYITAGVVKNVDLNENILKSLMQLQEKIHETFGRKRKKVAIGIHDLDKVKPPFTYKAVKPEEVEFTPLQSEEVMNLKEIKEKHPKGKYAGVLEGGKKWPIIVDKNNEVLSFPPVINGKLTQLTSETKNLFLDITGTDKKAIDQALNLVATTLAERDGKIETVEVNNKLKPNFENRKIKVDLNYINKTLGLELSEEKIKGLIEGMGFGYDDGNVTIPVYRTDIMHPIDIVEDIAIRYGYNNFEPEIPEVSGIGKPDGIQEFSDIIKDMMIGYGFQEVTTPIFTNKEDQFDKMEMEEEEVAEAENALNENYYACRKYILPQLMDVLKQNKHRSYPQKLFEVEDIVKLDNKAETGATNVRKLAAVVSDETINYTDLASKIEFILNNFDVKYTLKENNLKKFIEGRSAKILVQNKEIGVIGEIDPKVLENWSLERPVVAFEINLEKIKNIQD
ncbi:MAG: phenylalanine--tRNA ligase subunit beta [Candidatus Aenigmatarchaeota archaeon]